MIWYLFLLAAFVAIVLAKVFLRGNERAIDFSLYRKRERVMNESEQALFINLQKVFGERYIVLSKVRVEDFVEASRGDGWLGARGRIKARHVDFLICDRATTKPLLAIELDGNSHRNENRQKRDRFIDELYHSIDLPIQHIPVGSNFLEQTNALAQRVEKHDNTKKGA